MASIKSTTKRLTSRNLIQGGKTNKPTEIEALMHPYCGKSMHIVRLILPKLRQRMSDEEIRVHIETLKNDNWPAFGIGYTFKCPSIPLPSTNELIEMRKALSEIGLSIREAVLIIMTGGYAQKAVSADILRKKLSIAFNGTRIQIDEQAKSNAPNSQTRVFRIIRTIILAETTKLEKIRTELAKDEISNEAWASTFFVRLHKRIKK